MKSFSVGSAETVSVNGTTEAEGKASRKLGVLTPALAVVSDATAAPVAQHELISRHDIPF